jgi:cold shock protein
MKQGTIKTIRDEKGFGFITPDGETTDVFFHSNSVEGMTFEELREGNRVQFMDGTDPRNPRRTRAEHVQMIVAE